VSEEPPTPDLRLFTVAEANALVPKLEWIMARMQRAGVQLRSAIDEYAAGFESPPDEDEVSRWIRGRPDLQELVAELEAMIAEIESYGAQFKGLDLGLVDFPAEIEGQIGLLCWQYGEKEITHWHDLEGGFAKRRPLRGDGGGPYLQ
jgi:hypothetical protein